MTAVVDAVLAGDGSRSTALAFSGPLIAMLVVLAVATGRDRRRRDREDER